jgi:Cu/Ag efflux pump CusA
MMAGATALALIPLAAAGDIPGHEVEHPVAIVILGGIVTSTAPTPPSWCPSAT